MPIAVITESMENTRSNSMIWPITRADGSEHLGLRLAVLARRLDLRVDLVGGLRDQEEPAGEEDQVAARDALARAR